MHLTAVLCGVSRPPGMNVCVKQKKLDEEGGRVNEERGLGLGMGVGVGVGVEVEEGDSSVRCLSG